MSLNFDFSGLFSSSTIDISVGLFVLCLAIALAIGVFNAFIYTKVSKHSKSFVVTLSIIPAVVCMIIMMVNGNIGTGVAVAGAFSLIRFRSVPGTAKEIGAIFTAMGAGISLGMGFVGFAVVFTLIVTMFIFFLSKINFGDGEGEKRVLKITIPEDLNYTEVFDDLFSKYLVSSSLNFAKTSNMGSLYKLSYDIQMINPKEEKQFIDDLRCRNGNLEISIAKEVHTSQEL